MTIPTLTTLPVAPARTDPPATFVTRADAFLAAIVTFQGEMNTSIGAMNTDIAQVNTDATAAAASASAAASSATAAANAAGAALWVSGQSYAEGDAAISGVNYQTYRAETATSGTTDPSLDANWTAISGTFPNQTGNAGKFLTTDGTDTSWGEAPGFPSGTAMLFQQTTAPTGWTKSTTHDDKALRVVSGTVGSGGSVAFTSAFTSQSAGGTVGDTTLTIDQIPSHTHTGSGGNAYQYGTNFAMSGAIYSSATTSTTGGGLSHTHSFTGSSIDLSVNYVDVIIATKD